MQLSVLGLALHPIFVLGTEYFIVTAYVDLCMVTMASHVTSSQPLHMFKGQFALVITALAMNVSLLSELTYRIIVRPMVPA